MLQVTRASSLTPRPRPGWLRAPSASKAATSLDSRAARRRVTASPRRLRRREQLLGGALSQVAGLRLPIPWPGKGEADKIGWIQKAYPPAKDATAEFEQLDEAVRAGQDVLPAEAKDCVFLAVGGLLSGAAPKELYFDQNLDALKDAGCRWAGCRWTRTWAWSTTRPSSARRCSRRPKSGKKVVLIGHSKGGLDSAAALAMYPELKDHVRALVTIQSPYGGSPMAQDLLDNPLVRFGLGGAVEALGGSIQAVRTSPTTRARSSWPSTRCRRASRR